MSATVLYAANPDEWPVYRASLDLALKKKGVVVRLVDAVRDAKAVDYIVYAPCSGIQDFTPFANLKAVLSLWAGVESFQHNPTLGVPLARMVDDGLSAGMAEWVLGHVMRLHLGTDAHVLGQDGVWRNDVVAPLAHSRTVGILGLGELGRRSARYLLAAGFNVCGWSRRLKSEPGVACYSGETGLKEVLGRSDYLVLLLPLTEETEGILGGENLAMLPKGAVVLNPGRGSLIRDEALLDALGDGRLRHAVLDVFRTEPLAPGHPYWAHPRVTVTPHIASATRPETASDTIAENIRRGEAGEPFLYLVDRGAGY